MQAKKTKTKTNIICLDTGGPLTDMSLCIYINITLNKIKLLKQGKSNPYFKEVRVENRIIKLINLVRVFALSGHLI